jgi:hypothetical protein
MLIPKGVPSDPNFEECFKVYGRWSKYIMAGDEKIFDSDSDQYYQSFDEKYPLPSHSNYREDIVYRRLNNFVLSQ